MSTENSPSSRSRSIAGAHGHSLPLRLYVSQRKKLEHMWDSLVQVERFGGRWRAMCRHRRRWRLTRSKNDATEDDTIVKRRDGPPLKQKVFLCWRRDVVKRISPRRNPVNHCDWINLHMCNIKQLRPSMLCEVNKWENRKTASTHRSVQHCSNPQDCPGFPSPLLMSPAKKRYSWRPWTQRHPVADRILCCSPCKSVHQVRTAVHHQ